MKLLGIIIVVNTLIAAVYWFVTHGSFEKSAYFLAGAGLLVGFIFFFSGQITELSILGVGNIKMAAEKAMVDAKAIGELKDRITSQSATIDLVAKDASDAKKLTEDLKNKNTTAEEKLTVLDKAIAKATSSLTELESVTEFTTTVVAAQNDDRKAFDKLETWSKDKTHPFCDRAQQAWNMILEKHAQPMYQSHFTIPWNEGFDPSKLTLPNLAQQYQSAPGPLKIPLLEYIWNRQDFAKFERLDFLMNVMQHDESLIAVEYAGRYFTSGTDQKIKPLAVYYLSDWWKEHRHEFKEK